MRLGCDLKGNAVKERQYGKKGEEDSGKVLGLFWAFRLPGFSGVRTWEGNLPIRRWKNRYGGRFEIEEAAGNKIFLRLDMDVENLGTEKRPFLYSWHLRQERKAGFSGLSRRSL